MEIKRDGFKGQKAIVLPYNITQMMKDDDISRLMYVTDIGYYPCASGHYRNRPEGSEQNIFIYCTEGEGWISVEGSKVTLKKNQFYIIEAGKKHSYGADAKKPWSIYWIHFTGEKCSLFSSVFNTLQTIDEAASARFKDRILLFEEVFQNLEMGYNIENLQYTSICLFHLLGSLRYIPQFREINKKKSDSPIDKAIAYMKENIDQRLTLDQIAQEVAYSASHFSIIFFKKTGHTPLDFFNHLKIQTSCQYLDFTDMKIKEIAVRLGFADQYYFSKVFTKYMNCSPSEYRATEKG